MYMYAHPGILISIHPHNSFSCAPVGIIHPIYLVLDYFINNTLTAFVSRKNNNKIF